ncbi:MAG: hypothetical protein J6X69_07555 [Bacteroidales bacterium]|nr:hypothetical protein [Bacteroidales bacterium]
MRKILYLIVMVGALASCGKKALDPNRPLDVEFESDVAYEADTLLYLNLSEETSLNMMTLQNYIKGKNFAAVMLFASTLQATQIQSLGTVWGYPHQYVGTASGGKQAFILCKEKAQGSITTLAGAVAATFPSYTLVSGSYNPSLLTDTNALKGRIILFEAGEDPSEEYYRLSFCNCINYQWGIEMATCRKGKQDYIFARPAQWSLMGVISMDKESVWVHHPLRFTIKKEK